MTVVSASVLMTSVMPSISVLTTQMNFTAVCLSLSFYLSVSLALECPKRSKLKVTVLRQVTYHNFQVKGYLNFKIGRITERKKCFLNNKHSKADGQKQNVNVSKRSKSHVQFLIGILPSKYLTHFIFAFKYIIYIKYSDSGTPMRNCTCLLLLLSSRDCDSICVSVSFITQEQNDNRKFKLSS